MYIALKFDLLLYACMHATIYFIDPKNFRWSPPPLTIPWTVGLPYQRWTSPDSADKRLGISHIYKKYITNTCILLWYTLIWCWSINLLGLYKSILYGILSLCMVLSDVNRLCGREKKRFERTGSAWPPAPVNCQEAQLHYPPRFGRVHQTSLWCSIDGKGVNERYRPFGMPYL